MTIPTLTTMLELAGEQARRVLITLGKDLMPTWLLIDKRGKMSILGTPWKNQAERDLAKQIMRKLVHEQEIVAYSIVSEAWIAHKPAGWTPESDPNYQGASREPDRREAVVAIASNGQATEFRAWAIQRDWNEQVRALEPLESDYEAPLLGWMAELLKEKP